MGGSLLQGSVVSDRFGRLPVLLIVAIVVSTAVIGLAYYETPGAKAPSYPTVGATLGLSNPNASSPLPSTFFGVNLRADYPMGAQGSAVAATSARLVRWPGGALADRFDPLAQNGAGLIYNAGAMPYPAPTPASTFVQWCQSTGCQAIVTLPGEINSPAYASEEVAYFEHTLGFRPAYWEIGNEPAGWVHWGYMWADWSPGQNVTPSPMQYAQEVQAYILAIRQVDPVTPIIGLPGTGTGVEEDPLWIEDAVTLNAGNISAIATHIYPAGEYSPNTTAGQLFSSLNSPGSLPGRIATDEAAIRSACASCQISLLAEEVGVASAATGAPISFPWVPYEAAELVQGLASDIHGLLFWTSQGSYPGSWLSGSGSNQLLYTLFSSLPNPLPVMTDPIRVSSQATGVYATQLGSSPQDPQVVLLVNTNVTYSIQTNLSSVVPPGLPGSVLTWSNTTSQPVSHVWNPAVSAVWTILPDSVLIWESSA
jgi:hypothetical protein